MLLLVEILLKIIVFGTRHLSVEHADLQSAVHYFSNAHPPHILHRVRQILLQRFGVTIALQSLGDLVQSRFVAEKLGAGLVTAGWVG